MPSSFLEELPDGLPPVHLDLDERRDAELEVESNYANLLKKINTIDATEQQDVQKAVQNAALFQQDEQREQEENKIPSISFMQLSPKFQEDMDIAKKLKETELATQAQMDLLMKHGAKAASFLETGAKNPFSEPKDRAANDAKLFDMRDREARRNDQLELALEAQLQRDFPRAKPEIAAGSAPSSFLETGKAANPFSEPKDRAANDAKLFDMRDREARRNDQLE